MFLQRSIGAALAMTLINSNSFAWARGMDQSADLQQVVAVSTTSTGFGFMKENAAPPVKAGQKTNQAPPLVEKYLLQGNLAEGEVALTARLKGHPNDDQCRFGLGVLQFLRAVEGLGQDLYHYGLRDFSRRGFILPFLRLPVEANFQPEMITYLQLRQIADSFRQRLVDAEATLAPIKDPDVKLPLHFGMIRLDLNGDGHADENESLWRLYAELTNNKQIPEEKAQDFFIKFDRGDVHWLRGYCHLLSSLCDMYLAYDTKDSFEHTAHLFFIRVDSPYPYLSKGKRFHGVGESDVELLDLIAMVHLINWTVVEPERMESALHHLEAVVTQSRETWKWIMAETDDDHEWLPNPRQTGVIPNVRVTEEMVTAWGKIMDESEKLLKGELLIPYWRGDQAQGINLRKVFLEPRTFDLVLWVQGTAGAPLSAKGRVD